MAERFIATLSLTDEAVAGSLPNSAVIADAVWALAASADHLDHVHVARPEVAGRLAIVLILRADSEVDALLRADLLGGRLLKAQLLRGWTLRDVDVLPLARLLGDL